MRNGPTSCAVTDELRRPTIARGAGGRALLRPSCAPRRGASPSAAQSPFCARARPSLKPHARQLAQASPGRGGARAGPLSACAADRRHYNTSTRYEDQFRPSTSRSRWLLRRRRRHRRLQRVRPRRPSAVLAHALPRRYRSSASSALNSAAFPLARARPPPARAPAPPPSPRPAPLRRVDRVVQRVNRRRRPAPRESPEKKFARGWATFGAFETRRFDCISRSQRKCVLVVA